MSVYAIRNTRTQSVKIGYSEKPEGRVSDFQTGTEDELVLEAYVHGDKGKEKRLQESLKAAGEHVRGEWFHGPQTDNLVHLMKTLSDHEEEEEPITLDEPTPWDSIPPGHHNKCW